MRRSPHAGHWGNWSSFAVPQTVSEGGNAPGWPSAARAWATVFLLVACYATAFVDRQILALLVEPVSRDLDITDTQFSLLTGLAFTFFYTIMGIPFAWLADRGHKGVPPGCPNESFLREQSEH